MSWEPLGTTGLREPPVPQICALNLRKQMQEMELQTELDPHF